MLFKLNYVPATATRMTVGESGFQIYRERWPMVFVEKAQGLDFRPASPPNPVAEGSFKIRLDLGWCRRWCHRAIAPLMESTTPLNALIFTVPDVWAETTT